MTGRLAVGDTSTRYRALVSDGAVGRIDEQFELGDYGEGSAIYTFAGARLVRYEENSRKRLIDPDDPQKLVAVERTIELDPSGSVMESRKSLDGVTVAASPADLSSVRNRADRLRSRALAQHAGDTHRTAH